MAQEPEETFAYIDSFKQTREFSPIRSSNGILKFVGRDTTSTYLNVLGNLTEVDNNYIYTLSNSGNRAFCPMPFTDFDGKSIGDFIEEGIVHPNYEKYIVFGVYPSAIHELLGTQNNMDIIFCFPYKYTLGTQKIWHYPEAIQKISLLFHLRYNCGKRRLLFSEPQIPCPNGSPDLAYVELDGTGDSVLLTDIAYDAYLGLNSYNNIEEEVTKWINYHEAKHLHYGLNKKGYRQMRDYGREGISGSISSYNIPKEKIEVALRYGSVWNLQPNGVWKFYQGRINERNVDLSPIREKIRIARQGNKPPSSCLNNEVINRYPTTYKLFCALKSGEIRDII